MAERGCNGQVNTTLRELNTIHSMLQATSELYGQRIETQAAHSERIVVVIPAYNEERFIASTVLQARKQAGCVIVVDDGSQDETARLAREVGALVIQHAINRGKGAALNTGLREARRFNPEAVVLLDADGQHRPGEMPRLLAPILLDQADIIFGSRYLEKHSCVPGARLLGHRLFNLLTRLATGRRVSDSQCGFRALSSRALDLLSFCSQGFEVETEMQFLIQEHGLRFREEKVTAFYADQPKRPLLLHGLLVLGGVIRLMGHYRPLLCYGVVGAILFLIGSLTGYQLLEQFSLTRQLAVIPLVIAGGIVFLGVITFFVGIILQEMRGMFHPRSASQK